MDESSFLVVSLLANVVQGLLTALGLVLGLRWVLPGAVRRAVQELGEQRAARSVDDEGVVDLDR